MTHEISITNSLPFAVAVLTAARESPSEIFSAHVTKKALRVHFPIGIAADAANAEVPQVKSQSVIPVKAVIFHDRFHRRENVVTNVSEAALESSRADAR